LDDVLMMKGRNCWNNPPPSGEFAELPAGGKLMMEVVHTGGQSTMEFGGQYTSDFGDGFQHTDEDLNGYPHYPPEYCNAGMSKRSV
jgi:hypothetical protein